MKNKEKGLILRTLETLYETQLNVVRQLLDEEDAEISPRRKRRLKRQSIIDNVVNLLTQEKRPLHVNEMVLLLSERFGRVTDRDTLSSALAKKARLRVLVQQTAPATFCLIETASTGEDFSTSCDNHSVFSEHREGDKR